MPESDELASTKQQRHADLAAEHDRLKSFHEKHSGDRSGETKGEEGSPTSNIGSNVGGFFAMLGEHKFLVIGGIAAAIFFLYIMGRGSSSGASNQSPDYSSSEFVPANLQAQLDSINAQISGIAGQMGQGNTQGGTGTGGGTGGGTGTGGGGVLTGNPPKTPATTQKYVTVQKWTPVNTPWNSTLWGIASHEGINLARIEALNPNISNPNLVYAGQKIRVK